MASVLLFRALRVVTESEYKAGDEQTGVEVVDKYVGCHGVDAFESERWVFQCGREDAKRDIEICLSNKPSISEGTKKKKPFLTKPNQEKTMNGRKKTPIQPPPPRLFNSSTSSGTSVTAYADFT